MKDLLLLIGVTLAKRCNKRQKRIFYSQIVPFFEKFKYRVELQESEGRFNQTTNVLIGDIKKARNVVVCPYDTPTTTLLPYRYYPFNLESNLRQDYTGLAINFFIYLLVGGLLFFSLNYFSGTYPVLKTINTVLLVAVLIFGYLLLDGTPNPVNFNKNSASVALLAALAEKKAHTKDTCFILLDKNATGSTGLRLLTREARLKNKLFVYLDCLAFGEKIACVHSQESEQDAQKLQECLRDLNLLDKAITGERVKGTYLQYFPRMIHICAGSIDKDKNFVVLNTRSKKDFQVDVARLEKIRDGLLLFLEG